MKRDFQSMVTLGRQKISQAFGACQRQREPVCIRLDIKVIQERRLNKILGIDLEKC